MRAYMIIVLFFNCSPDYMYMFSFVLSCILAVFPRHYISQSLRRCPQKLTVIASMSAKRIFLPKDSRLRDMAINICFLSLRAR